MFALTGRSAPCRCRPGNRAVSENSRGFVAFISADAATPSRHSPNAEKRTARSISQADLAAPIRRFRRDVLCTGWNYWDHFEEVWQARRSGRRATEGAHFLFKITGIRHRPQ